MKTPDQQRGVAGLHAHAPVIILVDPQLGDNIGTTARAMLNCGFGQLRLVRPRDGWPNPAAERYASGATCVLDGVQVYDTTEAAIADLHYVVACTARRRDMIKPVLTPEQAAAACHTRTAQDQRCGILFGAERAGLVNEDIVRSDAIVTVPLNPDFASLNLAQAVLLLCYTWVQGLTKHQPGDETLQMGATRPATKQELQTLLDHLETTLDQTGYFRTPELKPTVWASIQNTFQRMQLTEQEARTFHGVIKSLHGQRLREKS